MASATQGVPLERISQSLSVRRPVRVRATKHAQYDATVLGGVRLRYVDVRPSPLGAEHGPPLVMLHGMASRIEEYEDIIDPLREGRRVIVMDLPGNGYSDKPERAYTLAFLEDAVLALMDGLGVAEADLAGGSLGGHLALRLAHRASGRFRRLAPWSPAGAWQPRHALRLLFTPWLRALFWPWVWVQSRFWYHPAWRGRRSALLEAFAHYREIHTRGFVRMYFDLARAQLETSLFPIAPGIAQPTLVLWGDRDRALGMKEGVEQLVNLLPNARLCVVAGARHALANEVPERLAREVDAFLR